MKKTLKTKVIKHKKKLAQHFVRKSILKEIRSVCFTKALKRAVYFQDHPQKTVLFWFF